ncbi:MAG: hypothetical protein OXF93_13125 [Acidobacteria bacterium]|nr:hypothetical protein [Acidobacteriota bacterium]
MTSAACAGIVLLGVAVVPSRALQPYEATIPGDHPALGLRNRAPDNAVHELEFRLADGRTTWSPAGDSTGYLQTLLDRLDINADSQVLVFSRTSLQRQAISPRRPRAIYFNDEVAVAFVPGSDRIELAAVDPGLGVAFYELEAVRGSRPRLMRSTGCLRCHHGPATLGVPGLYVGSVFPSPSGEPNFGLGTIVTDHRTPLAERWGGWYVTGTHGAQSHRGNAVARDPARPGLLDVAGARNQTGLARKADTSRYLQPGSDIVALMVLEHQTQMTNHLTRLAWLARLQATAVESATGGARRPGDRTAASSVDRGGEVGIAHRPGAPNARLDHWIEETVAYLLFSDEAALADPIAGVSTFTATFPRRGPHDARGRSLRDFDLQTRLFRYPLSYLIYGRAFDALPDGVRERVYAGLYEVLTGADRRERFRHLTESDRQAIRDIVAETKPNLPPFWLAGSARSPDAPAAP